MTDTTIGLAFIAIASGIWLLCWWLRDKPRRNRRVGLGQPSPESLRGSLQTFAKMFPKDMR